MTQRKFAIVEIVGENIIAKVTENIIDTIKITKFTEEEIDHLIELTDFGNIDTECKTCIKIEKICTKLKKILGGKK